MENKKRIQFFDICKGVLIGFVVLGHVMPEKTSIHMWIYSWHMPAFFMISGILMVYTQYDKRPLITRGVIRAMIASMFCIVGASVWKLILQLRDMELRILAILALVLVGVSILMFVFTGMNVASLNTLNLGNPVLYILNALVGCSMIFTICACLVKSNCDICKKIFCFFGRESLIVMGTHQALMILLHIPIKESVLLNLMFFAIIMVSEVPCVFLIRKMRSIKERIVVSVNGK